MLKGDSTDMCAGKFPLMSMGGQAEGLPCADPPKDAGLFSLIYIIIYILYIKYISD